MNKYLDLIHEGIYSIANEGLKTTAIRVKGHFLKANKSAVLDMQYVEFIKKYDSINEADMIAMTNSVDSFIYKPKISIVVPVYNTNHEYLRLMLDSVISQTYNNWELCIADDASPDVEIKKILEEYSSKDNRIKIKFCKQNGNISVASNAALSIATGEYVALVDHDDLLPAHALWTVVYYINKNENAVDLLYSDEDKLDENGNRFNPYFKCDWNRHLIFQQNYVAHLGVYRKAIIDEIGGFRKGFEGSQDYDLLLRFIKSTSDSRIIHIPYVLYHWRKNVEHASFSTKYQSKSDISAKKALEEFFDGKRQIEPVANLVGCWHVKRQLLDEPKVSIIIPFRDKVFLLKQCVEGILHNTNYDNIELILVDNNSQEESTQKYLDSLKVNKKVKVLIDEKEFNYSRLNNEAVRIATGEIILLLNNDIAIMEPNWLREMVAILLEENVGIVGAKLLYANKNIQHAGVVTGIYEVAAHPFRHISDLDVGFFGWPVLEREVSAVTGACLLTWKKVFEEVEGLDENHLRVSFNDVDYCLKVKKAGYKIVYTPYAKLYHLESQSRGDDLTNEQKKTNYEERHYMHEKYGFSLKYDPYYSPMLSLDNEDATMAAVPRVSKLWNDTIEFVCPFHRGDVLIGLQVACTASTYGKKIRMHVSKDVINWISDFPYSQFIEVVPVDVPLPKACDTEKYWNQAIELVSGRDDFSGKMVIAHPKRDLDKMGLDIVEFMLEELGLPIDTPLVNMKPLITDFSESFENLVLIHPNAGWSLKSISEKNVKMIQEVVHKYGYKLYQIGGSNDPKSEYIDGLYLENKTISEWAGIFKKAKAVICADSWTSHFGAILDVNQVVVYGATSSRDVESKKHFSDKNGNYLVLESQCDVVPCNSLKCRFGDSECIGMNIDVKEFESFIRGL